MWWNFIGRSRDEVVEFRRRWQSDVIDRNDPDGPFGTVEGTRGRPLSAPDMPTVRLKPRQLNAGGIVRSHSASRHPLALTRRTAHGAGHADGRHPRGGTGRRLERGT